MRKNGRNTWTHKGFTIHQSNSTDASTGRYIYTISDDCGAQAASVSDRITSLRGCKNRIDNSIKNRTN